MDSSPNEKIKGKGPKKTATAKPSLPSGTKNETPSQSSPGAANTSQPATSRITRVASRLAATKMTPETTTTKTSTKTTVSRTVIASPKKPSAVTEKDQASPNKSSATQSAHLQTRDKRQQQVTTHVTAKSEAPKKSVGRETDVKTPAREDKVSIPTKRNNAAKKDSVGLPALGTKGKTQCQQPQRTACVPIKQVTTAPEPAKPVKNGSAPTKQMKTVLRPDKPVNNASLPVKTMKNISSPGRLVNTSSGTTKPVKTQSATRGVSVPAKPVKAQSVLVKPATTESTPAKLLKSAAKSIKPVKNVSVPTKSVKTATRTVKSVITDPVDPVSIPVKSPVKKVTSSLPAMELIQFPVELLEGQHKSINQQGAIVSTVTEGNELKSNLVEPEISLVEPEKLPNEPLNTLSGPLNIPIEGVEQVITSMEPVNTAVEIVKPVVEEVILPKPIISLEETKSTQSFFQSGAAQRQLLTEHLKTLSGPVQTQEEQVNYQGEAEPANYSDVTAEPLLVPAPPQAKTDLVPVKSVESSLDSLKSPLEPMQAPKETINKSIAPLKLLGEMENTLLDQENTIPTSVEIAMEPVESVVQKVELPVQLEIMLTEIVNIVVEPVQPLDESVTSVLELGTSKAEALVKIPGQQQPAELIKSSSEQENKLAETVKLPVETADSSHAQVNKTIKQADSASGSVELALRSVDAGSHITEYPDELAFGLSETLKSTIQSVMSSVEASNTALVKADIGAVYEEEGFGNKTMEIAMATTELVEYMLESEPANTDISDTYVLEKSENKSTDRTKTKELVEHILNTAKSSAEPVNTFSGSKIISDEHVNTPLELESKSVELMTHVNSVLGSYDTVEELVKSPTEPIKAPQIETLTSIAELSPTEPLNMPSETINIMETVEPLLEVDEYQIKILDKSSVQGRLLDRDCAQVEPLDKIPVDQGKIQVDSVEMIVKPVEFPVDTLEVQKETDECFLNNSTELEQRGNTDLRLVAAEVKLVETPVEIWNESETNVVVPVITNELQVKTAMEHIKSQIESEELQEETIQYQVDHVITPTEPSSLFTGSYKEHAELVNSVLEPISTHFHIQSPVITSFTVEETVERVISTMDSIKIPEEPKCQVEPVDTVTPVNNPLEVDNSIMETVECPEPIKSLVEPVESIASEIKPLSTGATELTASMVDCVIFSVAPENPSTEQIKTIVELIDTSVEEPKTYPLEPVHLQIETTNVADRLLAEPPNESIEPIKTAYDLVNTFQEPIRKTIEHVHTISNAPGSVDISVESMEHLVENLKKSSLKSINFSVKQENYLEETIDTKEPTQVCNAENATEELSQPLDMFLCSSQMKKAADFLSSPEDEGSWVMVKREELLDFKEEAEDKPCRPVSLSHEGEEKEDDRKGEEERETVASACSTLSDPQLAGQSSSETSTPEELRTYEDSSSGVESHSDDMVTSPPTTLTPDPDLGIHMGQEEGGETPAGTPASKGHRAPHTLEDSDRGGHSQGAARSEVFDPSKTNPTVMKKEVSGSNCPRETTEARGHEDERASAEGSQRGTSISPPADGLYTIYESERGPQERSPRGAELGLVEQIIGRTLLLAASEGGVRGGARGVELGRWAELLSPLDESRASITSVTSFSPEGDPSPQGDWTVVEVETFH
ncbi:uncharacterized protein O3C94_009035 [Discoglossus pictus]